MQTVRTTEGEPEDRASCDDPDAHGYERIDEHLCVCIFCGLERYECPDCFETGIGCRLGFCNY